MPTMAGGSRSLTHSTQLPSKAREIDRENAATPTQGEFVVRLPQRKYPRRRTPDDRKSREIERIVEKTPVLRTTSPQSSELSRDVEDSYLFDQHIADMKPHVNLKAYTSQSKSLNLQNPPRLSRVTVPTPFFAFGRLAYPTQATKNEDCRVFLHSRCRYYERCHRVHPILPPVSLTSRPESSPSMALASSNTPQKLATTGTAPILTSHGGPALPSQNPLQAPPPAQTIPPPSIQPEQQRPAQPTPSAHSATTVSLTEKDSITEAEKTDLDDEDEDLFDDSLLFGSAPCSPLPHDSDHLSQISSEAASEAISFESSSSSHSTFETETTTSVTSASTPPSSINYATTVTSMNTGQPTLVPIIRPYCRDWIMNCCPRGSSCDFYHGDIKYYPPVKGVHPRPRFSAICPNWEANRCMNNWCCDFVHGDLMYDDIDWIDPSQSRPQAASLRPGSLGELVKLDPSEREKKPPPPMYAPIVCRNWLVNRCPHLWTCRWVHNDIEYDPPVLSSKYPLPKFDEPCTDPQCARGYGCKYTHRKLDYSDCMSISQLSLDPSPETESVVSSESSYDDPPPGQRPRPASKNPCLLQALGQCPRRYRCKYFHEDLEYDPAPADRAQPDQDPPVGRRPLPPIAETCVKWLRDECPFRYSCKFRHGDLDYDPLFPPGLAPPAHLAKNVATQKTARPSWSLRVRDHVKVKIASGFEVQEITTGFETPWVYITNIPKDTTADEVSQLVGKYGEVLDIKLSFQNRISTTKVRMSTSAEALEVCTQLNGIRAFGNTIAAKLPVSSALKSSTNFQDTSVRIRWEAPSRTAYCGYSTMAQAEKALAMTRIPFGDNCVKGDIHIGIPVVGIVTVRFRGIPIDAKDRDMERFNYPEDIVWAQPNYKDFSCSVNGIRRTLMGEIQPLDFKVLPPPYKHGAIAQAWAHFSTPAEADAACRKLHGWRPLFAGKTRITAAHVKSLTLSVSPLVYGTIQNDLRALKRTVDRSRRTAMSVFQRSPETPFMVKLVGDDLKELGLLKAEFEGILNWETLMSGSRDAYDAYFAHGSGQTYLDALRQKNPDVRIRNDTSRRSIQLRGSTFARRRVKEQILNKLSELKSRKIRTIPLDGQLFGVFLCKFRDDLCDEVGRDNIVMDMSSQTLCVRGDNTVFSVALEAVRKAKLSLQGSVQRRYVTQCPVCLDEVTQPILLPCGHSWCRGCLIRYLLAAIDTKSFPLTCLGKEGKCGDAIPLTVARSHLSQSDFNALVDAAFDHYIHCHPDEFRYCPTPDCSQIYRPGAPETVLQCPSCLLRICPNCHIEAHDGFDCPEKDGGHNLFKEWMKNHDVKPCPGCKVPIERTEGCNHMTCTMCKTHICWVCMQTFPAGKGIYDHMRSVHGGIGLPDPLQEFHEYIV